MSNIKAPPHSPHRLLRRHREPVGITRITWWYGPVTNPHARPRGTGPGRRR